MGLNCSHGAWDGSYSAFNRFRQAVCRVIEGSYPPHCLQDYLLWEGDIPDPNSWYWGRTYSEESHPGLHLFLCHSDCDGFISPKDCLKVANDLEAILPRLKELRGVGHIERAGGYAGACQKFIDGCRKAAAANEPLLFS